MHYCSEQTYYTTTPSPPNLPESFSGKGTQFAQILQNFILKELHHVLQSIVYAPARREKKVGRYIDFYCKEDARTEGGCENALKLEIAHTLVERN